MVGIVETGVLALLVLLVIYVFSGENGEKKLLQKRKGKPDEPIRFDLNNFVFPPLIGWPLYFMASCIFRWRLTGFLKDLVIKIALRKSNAFVLRAATIPEVPTFLVQVVPTKKQEEQKRPDFEALLKNQNGDTTPLQVAENALEAIQKSEKLEPKLRAFVQFNKAEALLMAQESTKRYAEKKPLSIIDGVPVGIKEEVEVAGYHRRCGTEFLGEKAEENDSNVVHKLRELGAVILGVTNMHELGFGTTGNNPSRFHGTARNPYKLDCHTGGSSSGSASAVAAGICPVTIGRDGGGSIRIPASLCGVVGLKGTFGRITGHLHQCLGGATVSHTGPICNNVRDTAIMYALLCGRDKDYSPGLIQPENATLEGFENMNLCDITVGVDWSYAEFADKEVVDSFREAVKYLQDHGATISSIQIPELEESRVAHSFTICAELTLAAQNVFPDRISELGAENILLMKTMKVISATDFILFQKQRTRSIEFMKTIFKEVDCVLTPATARTAPEIPKASLKYGMSDGALTGSLMRYAFLGNLTGIPGVVVPVGYDGNDLPIGVQVMAAWWEDHVALRVAHCLEGLVARKKPKVYYDIVKPTKST